MATSLETEQVESDLVKWLVSALAGHLPSRQIHLKLVSRFGLADDEARIVEERAIDGILCAISGSKRNLPDPKADPIGHAAFSLVWDTFNQNSFFDTRHSPSRKWLDWKEQQNYRRRD
jgi:hypothetical protein